MRTETLDKYFGADTVTKGEINTKLDELISIGEITEEDIVAKPDAVVRLAITKNFNSAPVKTDTTIKTITGESYQSDGKRYVKIAKVIETNTYNSDTGGVISVDSLNTELSKVKADITSLSAGSGVDIDNLTNKLDNLKYDNYANLMLDGTLSIVSGKIQISDGIFKYGKNQIQKNNNALITDVPVTTTEAIKYLAIRSDGQVRWYDAFPLQDPPYVYSGDIWYDELQDTFIENTGGNMETLTDPFGDNSLIDKFIYNNAISSVLSTTIINNGVTVGTNGVYGYEGIFNGTTNFIDTTKVLTTTDKVTVSLYVNVTNLVQESVLFMFSATGVINSGACGIKIINGSYNIIYPNNGVVNSSRVFNINTVDLGYAHIIAEFDILNSSVKVYIDGKLIDVAIVDSGVYDITPASLVIGGDNNFFLQGGVSNFEVFNRGLTLDEMQELSSQEKKFFQPIVPAMSFVKYPISVLNGNVTLIDTNATNYIYTQSFFNTANSFKLNGMTIDDISKYIRNVRYMQDNAPDMTTNGVIVGDMWFDTNDNILSMAVIINNVLTWKVI